MKHWGFLSDTHQRHNIDVPSIDILVHAGDATLESRIDELVRFNTWLMGLPVKDRIFVPGNHELMFEDSPTLARSFLDPSIHCLIDQEVIIDDLKIYGSPWQPEFNNWAFNLPRGPQLAEKWAKIPDDVDVLITHTPPYGIGDLTSNRYGPPTNVGCKDLLERIKKLPNLKLHVFGHVHPAYGVYKNQAAAPNVVFINAAMVDDKYRPVRPVITQDL